MRSMTPNNIAFPSRFKNQLLADEQLVALKNGTFQLLDEVGVHFPSHRALEIFSDHGARVDMHRQIVQIPPDLVKKAMATAPRAFTLGGREKRFDLCLDGNCSYICSAGTGVHLIDTETHQQRPSCKKSWHGSLAPATPFLWSVLFGPSYRKYPSPVPLDKEVMAGLDQVLMFADQKMFSKV